MSNYVISAPGALQPEMRGAYVDENAPASSASDANKAPGPFSCIKLPC
jgi:hypothetical protein